MSEEKFTQGKWDILDCRENPGADYDYSIVDSDGWYIAHIENCGLEEQEANAALIATAPEMLETLDEVGSDLAVAFASTPGIESKIWQDILKEDIQKICAVLKKARGEE